MICRKLSGHAAAGIIALLAVWIGLASATEQVFRKPMFGNNRVDYCYTWGQGCGDRAAHAFCQSQGFEKATSYAIANNIGRYSPTRTLGDTSVCANSDCDGFARITCYKPTPATDFNNPRFMDARLDWCFHWGADCGQAAANAFCQSQGFVRASTFQMAENVGPTRLIGTTQRCEAQDCDSFASIRCEN